MSESNMHDDPFGVITAAFIFGVIAMCIGYFIAWMGVWTFLYELALTLLAIGICIAVGYPIVWLIE